MRMVAPFAGTLLFWGVYAIAGLKPAIAATMILLLAELARRAWRRERPSPLFIMLSLMSVALGILDLALTSPLAIRFEGVATNMVFAIFFVVGSRRAKPLMQDLAEAARGPFVNDDPDRTRFFRWFGLLWAIYFVSRAIVCLATGLCLPITTALMVRSIYGTFSIVPMIAASVGGRHLFMWLQRRGWFVQRVGTGSTPVQS